jgi:DNA-binding CsgD family transcriptional regulator
VVVAADRAEPIERRGVLTAPSTRHDDAVAMSATPPEGQTELVGREAELERIQRFLVGVDSGPSALLLEGEPGIGKTTLWREGVRLARGTGHRVLSSRPAEAEASLSFAALGDLVDEVLDEVGDDLPGRQRDALESALLRGDPEDGSADPRAVSVAVLSLLRSLAKAGGVVVAIDDLQWMDPPSARAIGFAARRLEREPVVFLAASLPPADDHPFDLPEDRLERLQLGPLASDGLASLFRARLGVDLPAPTIRQLGELAGGNPFFALEMGRAFIRGEPAVTGQALPIPKNLREDLLRHRYAALSAGARRSVLVASAASHPTVDLLEAVGTVPDPEASLDEAVEAGFLERLGREIRFTHPFFRSAVYANEPRERRHTLHRALAEVATDPEERARHLALGADGPDGRVADVLEGTAGLASERGAPESAAELFELSAQLTPEDQSEAARRRRSEAARHHASLGDNERAIALLELVVADAPAGRSRAVATWFLARMTAIDGDLDRTAELLEDALGGSDLPSSAEGNLHAELAIASWVLGDIDRASDHAELALASLGTGDDPSSLGWRSAWPEPEIDARLALMARCRGLGAAAGGDLVSAEEALEEAADGYRTASLDYELGRTLLVLGSVRRRRKQKRLAREALGLALDRFEGLGYGSWAERATGELSRISGRRPSEGQLTPVEQRVARLAAAGRTNREIADVLFMSVRTVEGHLSRIYAKLGIRSRIDLALFPEAAEDPASHS